MATIKKADQTYYEMGFHLMSGALVDETLRNQLEEVLAGAREKIKELVMNNKQHILETRSATVHPWGKSTSCNIAEPKGMFDLSLNKRLHLMEEALSIKKVEHVYISDTRDRDMTDAFVQRAIEDEAIREGGQP